MKEPKRKDYKTELCMKKKIPTIQHFDKKTNTWLLIPSPGKGKCIKLCQDGRHYEIVNAK